jgi:hypothetical protein
MKHILFTAAMLLTGAGTAVAQSAPTPADSRNRAGILFEKQTHDLGVIQQGTPVTYTYNLKSTGYEPLIIASVSSSCGCIAVDWSSEKINPGKEGHITATYNAVTPGSFSKTITVLSNAKQNTVILTLKGTVKVKEPKE